MTAFSCSLIWHQISEFLCIEVCIPNCIAQHHSALEQNTQNAKWEMGTNAELCTYLIHKDALVATGLVGARRSHSSQSKLFRCVLTALHKWLHEQSQKYIQCLCCAASERLAGYSFEEGFVLVLP